MLLNKICANIFDIYGKKTKKTGDNNTSSASPNAEPPRRIRTKNRHLRRYNTETYGQGGKI